MKKSKFILWGIMFSFIGVCYAGELPVNNTIQQEELQTAATKMRLGMITEQEYLEKKNM